MGMGPENSKDVSRGEDRRVAAEQYLISSFFWVSCEKEKKKAQTWVWFDEEEFLNELSPTAFH